MSATTRNPKHEHINRYEVLNIINDAINNNPLSYKGCVNEIMERVKTASADVVERKTGKWIGGELGRCSCCGNKGCFSDIWPDGQVRYCPYCGADLRGEDDV